MVQMVQPSGAPVVPPDLTPDPLPPRGGSAIVPVFPLQYDQQTGELSVDPSALGGGAGIAAQAPLDYDAQTGQLSIDLSDVASLAAVTAAQDAATAAAATADAAAGTAGQAAADATAAGNAAVAAQGTADDALTAAATAQSDATDAITGVTENLRMRGNYAAGMAIRANDLVRPPAPWGPFSIWRAKVDIPNTPAGFTASVDWEYMSGRGSGTNIERQALANVPTGYEFWDTVTAGGQLFFWTGAAWQARTLGLAAAGGHMIAAPAAFAAGFDILAVGTVATDIGQQIVVPAQAGYWILKWYGVLAASTTGTNSAAAGGMLDLQIQITDAANTLVGVAERTWLTPPVNAVRNYREFVAVEICMDPIAVDTTYKTRAHLNVAAPASFVGTATMSGGSPWPASKLYALSAA